MPPTTRHIVLVGYRGCGKTTVGELLANRLNLPFIDTDALIIACAGQTIAEIFNSEGETGFRQREEEIVADVAQKSLSVVSLGGGAVLSDKNMERLKPISRVIWLRCPPETLHARITGDHTSSATRPSLTDCGGLQEVRTVLAQREPYYRRWSDTVIASVDLIPDEVTDAVELWLMQQRLGDESVD